jgi:hypothetical protein
MKSISEKNQSKWKNLSSEQTKVDPYPILRCILRYVQPKETVAGALKRMRPVRPVKNKKNQDSMDAEPDAATALALKRQQGEFSLLSDAVNTLMGLGEYDTMTRKHHDIVTVVDRIEKQRNIPSTVSKWLDEPALPSAWFIRWNGATEAHGPNKPEDMQQWLEAGYFNATPCVVAPEGSDEWKTPDQCTFIKQ